MTTPGQQLTPGDDQNPPEYGVPEGAYVGDAGAPNAITDLNDLNEAEAKRRMRAPINPSFTAQRDSIWGIFDHLRDAILGVLSINPEAMPVFEAINDGQRALINRVSLLDDVSGFAVAFMPVSRYTSSNNYRLMPFNEQLGPQKNATVDGNGYITLAKGTWTCQAQVTSDQHDHLPVFVRIEVMYPEGDPRINSSNEGVYSMKEYRDRTAQNRHRSYSVFHPVVCPEPGYRVRVRTRYDMGLGLNLLWQGGTMLSHLAVTRLDLDASNAKVRNDVPVEGNQ